MFLIYSMQPESESRSILAPIEKPWYSLLDFLDSKGVPVYNMIDPIDDHMPSVLLPILLLLLFFGVLLWLLFAGGAGGEVTLTINTLADRQPLEGVAVAALFGDSSLEEETGSKGTVELVLPRDMEVELELTRENCADKIVEVVTDSDKELDIELDCMTSAIFGSCVELPEELTSSALRGEDNSEPSNCRLKATTLDGDEVDTQWIVDEQNRLWFSQTKCVQDDYEIYIDCDNHERQAVAGEILAEAMQNGEIIVYSKSAIIEGLVADKRFNLYIVVQNEEGDKLKEIRAIAVDELGNEFVTGYGNTKTTDTTNVEGKAVLVMPEGVSYYVRAEDPAGEYAPTTTSLQVADFSKEIIIVMGKGERNEITVKSDEGTAVPLAPITIKQGDRIVKKGTANAQGKLTVVLLPGSYIAESAPSGFYPAAKEFSAGQEVELVVKTIKTADGKKAEPSTVKVLAIGPDEAPMKDVRVMLMYQGITAGDCVTRTSGKCTFTGLGFGEYSLTAVPPSDHKAQYFEAFEVGEGEVVEQTIVIDPTAFVLNVRAKTLTDFLKDVRIKLMSSTTGLRLADNDTDKFGRANFGVYLGQRVYLKAEHKDYPDVESGVIIINGNVDYTLVFEEVGEEFVTLVAPEELVRGETGTAVVRTVVPQNKKYKRTTIEIWTGEEGSKANPLKSPMVLGSVEAKNNAIVKVSDEYFNGKQPALAERKAETAKYIKYSTTSGGAQDIEIPLHAVLDASASKTEIHYKAKWETTEGEMIESEWKSKEIMLTGEGGVEPKQITNPYFTEYKAGWADKDAPESEWKDMAELAPGSVTYLHVKATPKDALTKFQISLDSYPPSRGDKHIVPISYSGHSGVEEIDEKLVRQFLPQTISISNKIEPRNELYLQIKMRAQEPIEQAEMEIFKDRKNTLGYLVEEDWVEINTSVRGISGVIMPRAEVCPPAGYEGSCKWGRFPTDSLLGSLSSEGPRKIKIEIEFRNKAKESTIIDFGVEATGIDELQYEREIVLRGEETEKIEITGIGSAQGIINFYLQGEKWTSIAHGVVDYSIEIIGDSPLTSSSSQIRARALRNGKAMEGTEFLVDGKALGLAKGYYTSKGLDIDLDRSRVEVTANHPEFVKLTKNERVRGIFFSPTEKDYKKPSLLLNDMMPFIRQKIVTITNNNEDAAYLTLSPKFDKTYLDLDIETELFDERENPITGNAIPPNGRAKIYFNAGSADTRCNERLSNNSLTIIAKSTAISEQATYFMDVSCNFIGGGFTGDLIVFRESGEINQHSCAMIENTAYLCDAEQISEAILDASAYAHNSGLDQWHGRYAFGNDYVNSKVADAVRQLTGVRYPSAVGEKGDNTLSLPELSCGLIDITLKTGANGAQTAVATMGEASWCKPTSPYYFIGAMNVDSRIVNIVPEYVKTMAATRENTGGKFFGQVLSTNDEAAYTVTVGKFGKANIDSLPVAEYSWLIDKNAAIKENTGYYHTARTTKGADFKMGGIDGQTNCFFSTLENHFQTGQNEFISKSNRGGVILANLGLCKDAQPIRRASAASIRIPDLEMHATNKDSVRVDVLPNCIVVAENKDGTQIGKKMGSQEWDITGLEYVLFKASCKENGVWSQWVTDYIAKDSVAPAIELPDFKPIEEDDFTFNFVVTDDYGVESCEIDVNSPYDYEPIGCYLVNGDEWGCSTAGQTFFKDPAHLSQERPSLIEFEVSCKDKNGNIGIEPASMYFYPLGDPGITLQLYPEFPGSRIVDMYQFDAEKQNTYYASDNPLQMVFDVSSKVGVLECIVEVPSEPIVECTQTCIDGEEGSNKCFEGTYQCDNVKFPRQGHFNGDDIVKVVCTEERAEEGSDVSRTQMDYHIVIDEEPPQFVSSDFSATPYDVTNCETDPKPEVKVTITDSWWDDEDGAYGDKTKCEAKIMREDGYADLLIEAVETDEKLSDKLLKDEAYTALKLKYSLGIKQQYGSNIDPNSDNIYINCSSHLYGSADWQLKFNQNMPNNGDPAWTEHMDMRLAGKIEATQQTGILNDEASTDVPVYLLPPDVTKAGKMLEKLAAHCYNNAYGIDDSDKDDSQVCYSVSFELLDGDVTPDKGSITFVDKGQVTMRAPQIGDNADCADDCVFLDSYTSATPPLFFEFNDTGHDATHYVTAGTERHQNKLQLTVGTSTFKTWSDQQAMPDLIDDKFSTCGDGVSELSQFDPEPASATVADKFAPAFKKWHPDADDNIPVEIGTVGTSTDDSMSADNLVSVTSKQQSVLRGDGTLTGTGNVNDTIEIYCYGKDTEKQSGVAELNAFLWTANDADNCQLATSTCAFDSTTAISAFPDPASDYAASYAALTTEFDVKIWEARGMAADPDGTGEMRGDFVFMPKYTAVLKTWDFECKVADQDYSIASGSSAPTLVTVYNNIPTMDGAIDITSSPTSANWGDPVDITCTVHDLEGHDSPTSTDGWDVEITARRYADTAGSWTPVATCKDSEDSFDTYPDCSGTFKPDYPDDKDADETETNKWKTDGGVNPWEFKCVANDGETNAADTDLNDLTLVNNMDVEVTGDAGLEVYGITGITITAASTTINAGDPGVQLTAEGNF